MKIFFIAALALFIFSAAAAAQGNASIYTSMRNCRTISSSAKEGGSYEGECPGVGGYKVRLLEGDIRQTLTVVTPSKKQHELNFWQFYGGFSYVGEKIEWRLKKGVPVALIARYNVADPEDYKRSTSYLMISKISNKGSCVTDVVLPQAKQNELARELADAAVRKPCKPTE